MNPDHTLKDISPLLATISKAASVPYAELRTQPRLDLARAIPLSAPLTVYVEPTNRCNLSCDFCPQSLEDYKERAGYWEDMPLSTFTRLMEELKGMNIKSLKLYFFGEPLMHREIGEMCRLAAWACDRVELTTNLIPLNQAKAKAILQSGIHYIRFSYYAEQQAKQIPKLEMLCNMRKFLGLESPRIAIKTNTEADEKNVSYLRLWSDEVVTERLHTIASDFVHLRSYDENKKACPYPFYTLVVKSNGDVVPCCVAWDKSLVVGNVSSNTLAELWRSPKMEEIRLAHLRGERSSLAACAQCDVLFNCPDSVDSVSAEEYKKRVDEPECWRKPWMSYSDNCEG